MADYTRQGSMCPSGNPIKDVADGLAYTARAAEELVEAIKLMEVPVSRWRIRSRAMEHAKAVQAVTQDLLTEHRQVVEELKTIGY